MMESISSYVGSFVTRPEFESMSSRFTRHFRKFAVVTMIGINVSR